MNSRWHRGYEDYSSLTEAFLRAVLSGIFLCAGAHMEISRFTACAPRGGQRKRHSPPDGKAGTQKEIRKERRQDDG